MKKISLVVPMFNEQGNIDVLYKRLVALVTNKYEWEFLFVDDGSKDKTWQLISDLALHDNQVKGISFARNFGHQKALAAGYNKATGDALICIDADLQDPPELIHDMLKQWEAGFKIVYARRAKRQDGLLQRLTAWGYYHVLHFASDVFMPRSVGDFRLIDRVVFESIKDSPEAPSYWRGTVAWTGFSYTFVDFVRSNRVAGRTGYTWGKCLQLAFNGLTGFSFFPLQIAGFVGALLCFTSLSWLCYLVGTVIVKSAVYVASTWFAAFGLLLMGGQFLCLWLLGEYIGRIYEHQKNRPLYVVKETVGFDMSVPKMKNNEIFNSANR